MFKMWRMSFNVFALGLAIGVCFFFETTDISGSAFAVAFIAAVAAATELGDIFEPDAHMLLLPVALVATAVSLVTYGTPAAELLGWLVAMLVITFTYFVAGAIAEDLGKPVPAVFLAILPGANIVTGPFAPLYVRLHETANEPLA